MNNSSVPWDKLIDFGLIIIGFAITLVPGIGVPADAGYMAIMLGLAGLGVNVKLNNFGRSMGRLK